MLAQINTVGQSGIEEFIINVQADILNGIPLMDIIGLPDTTVKEA